MINKQGKERDSIQLQNLRQLELPNVIEVQQTTEIIFENSNKEEYKEIYPDLTLTQEQAVARSLKYTILQRVQVKKKSFIKKTIRNIDMWSYVNNIISTDYGKDSSIYFKMSRWLTIHVAWITVACIVFLVIPMVIIRNNASIDDISTILSMNENSFVYSALFYGFYNQTQNTNGTAIYSISRAYFWVNILTRLLYFLVIIRKLIFSISIVFADKYSSSVLESTTGIRFILGMWDFRTVTKRSTMFCKENIKDFIKKIYTPNKISKKATTGLNIVINAICLVIIAAAFERITWLITDDEKFFQKSQLNTVLFWEFIRTPMVVSMVIVSTTWVFDLIKCIEDYEKEYLKVLLSAGRIILLNVGISVILIYHWSTMISCTNPGSALSNRTSCDLIRDTITISRTSLLYTCWETWLGQRILTYFLVNVVISFIFYLFIDIVKSIIRCTDTSFIKPKFFYSAFFGNLCYIDCLFWIGYYYSPVLSIVWLLTVLLLFFYNINMISITCFPRGSSSQTINLQKAIFIFMFAASSSIGIFSLIGHSILFKPSKLCGPFINLDHNYSPEDFPPAKYFSGFTFLKKVFDIGERLLISDGLWYSMIIVLLSLAFKSTFQVNALRKIYRLGLGEKKMIENDKKNASENCQLQMERLRLNRKIYQPSVCEADDEMLTEIYDNFVI